MSPELFDVIDILAARDLRHLLTIEELARERWQCSPTCAKRRLRAAGIRLVKVDGHGQGYRVRRSDVKALEQALTIYLKPRSKRQIGEPD